MTNYNRSLQRRAQKKATTTTVFHSFCFCECVCVFVQEHLKCLKDLEWSRKRIKASSFVHVIICYAFLCAFFINYLQLFRPELRRESFQKWRRIKIAERCERNLFANGITEIDKNNAFVFFCSDFRVVHLFIEWDIATRFIRSQTKKNVRFFEKSYCNSHLNGFHQRVSMNLY